jgi:AraC-like DNA-binding protein
VKHIPLRHIDKTQSETTPSGSFRIRAVSDLLGGQDLVHELHKHDFFFILALQNGAGTHVIDFTHYNVGDHSIFFVRPGQVHQLELKANCTGYLVEFDPSFYYPKNKILNQRLNRASHKNVCSFEVGRFEKLHSLLTYMFNEYTTKSEGYLEVIKANLDIFFIEVIRQSQNRISTSKNKSSYVQDRFEDFMEMLGDRITHVKQVSQYAELLNLSVYQLNTITKETIGKSASELINEQIVLEAKRHLLATPNQIKAIAEHLGYEDFSYFIRFFKKHTGYSPEAFRKNFQ